MLTWLIGSCPETAHAPPNTMTRLDSPTSTHNNSTTMAPIDEALEDMKSRKEGEQFCLKEIADKYGVDRSTLGRRWRGVTRSKEEGYAGQQILSPQQETELVRYIEKLTKRGLPPTREMIRNFSSEVAKRQLGERWCDRFIKRNQIHLITK
jgi:hypothetical protein